MPEKLIVIENQLVHYIKGCGGNFGREFKALFYGAKKWCCFHHDDIPFDINCYYHDEQVNYILKIADKYLLILEYLGFHPAEYSELKRNIEILHNPLHIDSYDGFKLLVDSIKGQIDNSYTKVKKSLKVLSCQEASRIDEAIDCYMNNCYLSATVMAVSAVESRLHTLIQKKNRKLYDKRFAKSTLGQILVFFKSQSTSAEEEKLKKLVPVKYYALIDILNQYRIFSAHPKSETFDHRIAQSILNLSFTFLLDEALIVKK